MPNRAAALSVATAKLASVLRPASAGLMARIAEGRSRSKIDRGFQQPQMFSRRRVAEHRLRVSGAEALLAAMVKDCCQSKPKSSAHLSFSRPEPPYTCARRRSCAESQSVDHLRRGAHRESHVSAFAASDALAPGALLPAAALPPRTENGARDSIDSRRAGTRPPAGESAPRNCKTMSSPWNPKPSVFARSSNAWTAARPPGPHPANPLSGGQ